MVREEGRLLGGWGVVTPGILRTSWTGHVAKREELDKGCIHIWGRLS